MKQRIVVLGGDGFIGRAVVSALDDSGWAAPVVAGRRARSGSERVEGVVVDATDAKALGLALRGADGVVNCLAGPPSAMIAAAENLFASVVDIPVVHLSSMAVYGSATGIVDETAPLRADLGPYSEAKLRAETVAAAYPRAIILRPGCVYGPASAQWTERIARLLQARRIGDLGAGGDGCSNLVHVADLAGAVLAALRTPAAQGHRYNLAMANAPLWNDYFFLFARALGAVPIARLSQRRLVIEGKILAPPLKIAEIIAGKAGFKAIVPPPIPPSLLRLWRQEIRLSAAKAERELSLEWTDLSRGLADAAAWIKAAS